MPCPSAAISSRTTPYAGGWPAVTSWCPRRGPSTWGGRVAGRERLRGGGTWAVLDAARVGGVPRSVLAGVTSIILDGTPIVDADAGRPLPRRAAGPYSATKAAGRPPPGRAI